MPWQYIASVGRLSLVSITPAWDSVNGSGVHPPAPLPTGSTIPTQCRVAVAVWKHGFPECWWPWNRKPWFATMLSQWGRNIDKVVFKILYKYLHFYSIVLFIELNLTKNQILKHKISDEVSFCVGLVGSIQKFQKLNLNATANKCLPHCGARRRHLCASHVIIYDWSILHRSYCTLKFSDCTVYRVRQTKRESY